MTLDQKIAKFEREIAAIKEKLRPLKRERARRNRAINMSRVQVLRWRNPMALAAALGYPVSFTRKGNP